MAVIRIWTKTKSPKYKKTLPADSRKLKKLNPLCSFSEYSYLKNTYKAAENEIAENHEKEKSKSAFPAGDAKSGGKIKMQQIKINSRYKPYFFI